MIFMLNDVDVFISHTYMNNNLILNSLRKWLDLIISRKEMRWLKKSDINLKLV